MITLETLKVVALLCQITVGTSGAGRDHRMNSDDVQKACQKYFAGCIYKEKVRTKSDFEISEDLRKCIVAR